MTATLALVDNGAALPGMLREDGYVLPPALPFERWQSIIVTLQTMQRSVSWWSVVKLQGRPGRDSGPAEASTTRLLGSRAMHLDPTTVSPLPAAASWWSRFVEKIEVAENGCWHWQRRIDRDGYGRFGINGSVWYAHRAAYAAVRGPLEAGQPLDHECHSNDLTCQGGVCMHRRCVNPWHCEPVTNRENVLRGRSIFAREAAATECVNGHPFTPENVYQWRGHRYCRTCRKHLQQTRTRAPRPAIAPTPAQARVLSMLADGGSLVQLGWQHFALIPRGESEPVCRVSTGTPASLRRHGWMTGTTGSFAITASGLQVVGRGD